MNKEFKTNNKRGFYIMRKPDCTILLKKEYEVTLNDLRHWYLNECGCKLCQAIEKKVKEVKEKERHDNFHERFEALKEHSSKCWGVNQNGKT